jgi:hypothetical protein
MSLCSWGTLKNKTAMPKGHNTQHAMPKGHNT